MYLNVSFVCLYGIDGNAFQDFIYNIAFVTLHSAGTQQHTDVPSPNIHTHTQSAHSKTRPIWKQGVSDTMEIDTWKPPNKISQALYTRQAF